jgi:hypothetical protein
MLFLCRATKIAKNENSQKASACSEAEPEEIFSKSAFAALGLSPAMCASASEHMHLDKPTLVQQTAIGDILEGRDVVLKGKTGLGKTLAFLLPIVDMLQRQEPRVQRADGTRAVILAPTKVCSLILVLYQTNDYCILYIRNNYDDDDDGNDDCRSWQSSCIKRRRASSAAHFDGSCRAC